MQRKNNRRFFILKEIAPGIDIQKQIIDLLDFEIQIASDIKQMDSRIFREEKMSIAIGGIIH